MEKSLGNYNQFDPSDQSALDARLEAQGITITKDKMTKHAAGTIGEREITLPNGATHRLVSALPNNTDIRVSHLSTPPWHNTMDTKYLHASMEHGIGAHVVSIAFNAKPSLHEDADAQLTLIPATSPLWADQYHTDFEGQSRGAGASIITAAEIHHMNELKEKGNDPDAQLELLAIHTRILGRHANRLTPEATADIPGIAVEQVRWVAPCFAEPLRTRDWLQAPKLLTDETLSFLFEDTLSKRSVQGWLGDIAAKAALLNKNGRQFMQYMNQASDLTSGTVGEAATRLDPAISGSLDLFKNDTILSRPEKFKNIFASYENVQETTHQNSTHNSFLTGWFRQRRIDQLDKRAKELIELEQNAA